jgi:tetrapyrrole methylase family protein / MazG family protein
MNKGKYSPDECLILPPSLFGLMEDFQELVDLMEYMRGPDGCPWDREQTIKDFEKYLRSESDEALEAIRKGDYDNLREELGDLLWHILFISQIAGEKGLFTVDDVLRGLREKIIRRHPHVFGQTPRLKTSKEVEAEYKRIKASEKRQNTQ